jgi:hypothetical protein
MVCVFSTMWRIKNQQSNFIFCIDNALRLLVLVSGILYWGLQVTSSFQFGVAFWRVVLREVYFEGPNRIWRALKISILNIGSHVEWLQPITTSLLVTLFTRPRTSLVRSRSLTLHLQNALWHLQCRCGWMQGSGPHSDITPWHIWNFMPEASNSLHMWDTQGGLYITRQEFE